MKEIANTGLLVSVHYNDRDANLEVFDISSKGQARKIYAFEQVSNEGRIVVKIHLIIILVTGAGDVTYNPRRSILGAISVGGKISYHLYNVIPGKAGNVVNLLRKSKWHSQYRIKAEEGISTILSIAVSFSIFCLQKAL